MQSLNKYFGKTRMESLMDRIKEANNILDILSKENTKIKNTKTNPKNFINKIEKMKTEINLEKDKSKLNNENPNEYIEPINFANFLRGDDNALRKKRSKSKKKNSKEKNINY